MCNNKILFTCENPDCEDLDSEYDESDLQKIRIKGSKFNNLNVCPDCFDKIMDESSEDDNLISIEIETTEISDLPLNFLQINKEDGYKNKNKYNN